MGFKKKVTSDLEVVSIHDDAVDWSRTPKADYVRTRDSKLLKIREAQAPTRFVIRSLPPGILTECEARKWPENLLMAFCFGTKSCSDSDLGLCWEGNSAETRHITEKSVDAIPAKIWKEIGKLVLDRANLSEGEEPAFFVPRG